MIARIACLARIVWMEMLRRKDAYVLLILLGALLAALVSLNVFGLAGLTVYVKDAGLLVVWVFGWILSIHVGCRELPQEEQRGVVFSLLAKPVSRLELILGKWLGAFRVVATALFAFYLLLGVVVVLHGGRGSLDWTAYAQGYMLHAAALGMLVAMGLLFSTRMHQDAATALTTVFSLGALLMVPRLPALMAHSRGASGFVTHAIYHLMPHFGLLDMRKRIVHNHGPAAGWALGLALLYAAVYTALLLWAAWLSYRNKRFSREQRV